MKKNYKIGYVQGTFDLFHIGHLNLLKRAKACCEYLIVGVVSDELNYAYKGDYPYIPYLERSEIVSSIQYVDQVEKIDFLNEDKLKSWEMYHYDCHFSGDDHEGEWENLIGQLKERGSDVVFFPYTEETSSTKIKTLVKSKLLYEQDSFFSFDVFDTLITRKTVTPKGIFALIRDKLNIEYAELFTQRILDDFYNLRIYYEYVARHEFCYKEDITLLDIYKIFAEYEGLNHEQVKILMEIELLIELDNIVGIEKNINLIKSLKKAGRQVVLISDMYLRAAEVRMLLTKVDLELGKLPLYVSSEYQRTKASKGLYQIVKNSEKVSYCNWVHCGDNAFADIKAAKALGIQTIHDKTITLSKREQIILQEKESDSAIQILLGQCKLNRLLGISVTEFDSKVDDLVESTKNEEEQYNSYSFLGVLKKSIVIYGAGKFGQRLYHYIHENQEKVCVGWIDQNYRLKQKEGFSVDSIEVVKELDFDQIVIAVLDHQIAESIRNKLLDMGIEKKKIIWAV